MRVLVDTSVWSLALRRQARQLNAEQIRLKGLLTELIADSTVVLIGPVRQELLSGIREQAQFRRVREHLADFPDLPPKRLDYERAAEMSNICSSRGIANTPTDMLICSVAHAAGLAIFTTDRDFASYARCLPIRLFTRDS